MSVWQAVANVMKKKRHIINRLLSETLASSSSSTARLSFGRSKFSYQHRWINRDPRLWFFLSGNAAIILAINSNTVLAKDASLESSPENESHEMEGSDAMQLRKIEDGSVKSNIHTSKWRVFTDKGRELFLQGKLEEAEKLFLSALQEAKEGFGKGDPHVASASNNLAELYRVNKVYNKAEPLYLEAISILEESFGPEDIRYTMILLQTMTENGYMLFNDKAERIDHAFVLINLYNTISMTQYYSSIENDGCTY